MGGHGSPAGVAKATEKTNEKADADEQARGCIRRSRRSCLVPDKLSRYKVNIPFHACPQRLAFIPFPHPPFVWSLLPAAMLSNRLITPALYLIPLFAQAARAFSPSFPYGSEKVRGVNLGGWLVTEPVSMPFLPYVLY